jgi:hypothetical protein
MNLSNNNANILMLDIHQDIEEYADYLVTKLLDEKDLNILTYPPNSGFTEEEINELRKLGNNEHLKSGLRKLIQQVLFLICSTFLMEQEHQKMTMVAGQE